MKIDKYHIVNADTYEYIKQIPSKSVDIILTDPPYNLSGYSTGNIKLHWRKEINNDLAEWDRKIFNPADWVTEFIRILKQTGTIFAFTSYNLLGKWHEAFDHKFDTFQFMVWHKTNPVPKIYKAGFLNSCELIVCIWNKGHTWNFISQKDMHNFIETPICMGEERLKNPNHPTQKPVKVLKHLIKIASNPEDLVFDPFMGVGSTGVAALELNRRFLGIEIDTSYFKAAEKRLKSAPLNIFVEKKEPLKQEVYAGATLATNYQSLLIREKTKNAVKTRKR
ncbi:MAG: site-specific DNA-methyltransferase [Planctomycetota bacterium]|nr:site-specific DNA-methyltransferase [Planctomycetota bacterium]